MEDHDEVRRGYIEDGLVFAKSKTDPADNLHVARSAKLHRALKDHKPGTSEEFFTAVKPYAEFLGIAWGDKKGIRGGDDIYNRFNDDLKRGKAGPRTPIFLAWLSATHPDVAAELYRELGLEPRPFPLPTLSEATPTIELTRGLPRELPSLSQFRTFIAEVFRRENDEIGQTVRSSVEHASTQFSALKRYGVIALGVAVITALLVGLLGSGAWFQLDKVQRDIAAQSVDWPIENASGHDLPIALGLLEKQAGTESNQHRLSNVLSTLGLLQLLMNQDDALANAIEATEISPGNHSAWERLGIVHMARGEAESAATAVARATALSSSGAGPNLELVSDHTWIFGLSSAPAEGLSMTQKEEIWNALHAIPDQFIRDLSIVAASLHSLGYFADSYFADRMWQRTASCTNHFEHVLLEYCRVAHGIKLDLEGEYEQALAVWTSVSQDARSSGQLSVAVVADAHRARRLNANGSVAWPGALEILESAAADARKLGDSRTLFNTLWQLADVEFESAQNPEAALASMREASQHLDNLDLPSARKNGFLRFLAIVEGQVGDSAKAHEICELMLAKQTQSTPDEIWRKAVWLRQCSAYHSRDGNKDLANELTTQAGELFQRYADTLEPTQALSETVTPYDRDEYYRAAWAIPRLNYHGFHSVSDRIHLMQMREFRELSELLKDKYQAYFVSLLKDRLDTLLRLNVSLSNNGHQIPRQVQDIQSSLIHDLEEQIARHSASDQDVPANWQQEELVELKFRYADMFGPPDETFSLFKSVWISKFLALADRAEADTKSGTPPPGAFAVLFNDGWRELSFEDREAAVVYWVNLSGELDTNPAAWVGTGHSGVSNEFWEWADFIRLHADHAEAADAALPAFLTGLFAEIAADQNFPWAKSASLMKMARHLYQIALDKLEAADALLPNDSILIRYHAVNIEYVDFVDGTRGAARQKDTREHLWALYAAMMSARNINDDALALEFLGRFKLLHQKLIGPCTSCDDWMGSIATTDFGTSSEGGYAAMRRRILGLLPEQADPVEDELQITTSTQ